MDKPISTFASILATITIFITIFPPSPRSGQIFHPSRCSGPILHPSSTFFLFQNLRITFDVSQLDNIGKCPLVSHFNSLEISSIPSQHFSDVMTPSLAEIQRNNSQIVFIDLCPNTDPARLCTSQLTRYSWANPRIGKFWCIRNFMLRSFSFLHCSNNFSLIATDPLLFTWMSLILFSSSWFSMMYPPNCLHVKSVSAILNAMFSLFSFLESKNCVLHLRTTLDWQRIQKKCNKLWMNFSIPKYAMKKKPIHGPRHDKIKDQTKIQYDLDTWKKY